MRTVQGGNGRRVVIRRRGDGDYWGWPYRIEVEGAERGDGTGWNFASYDFETAGFSGESAQDVRDDGLDPWALLEAWADKQAAHYVEHGRFRYGLDAWKG